jgi:hypothetical protein
MSMIDSVRKVEFDALNETKLFFRDSLIGRRIKVNHFQKIAIQFFIVVILKNIIKGRNYTKYIILKMTTKKNLISVCQTLQTLHQRLFKLHLTK